VKQLTQEILDQIKATEVGGRRLVALYEWAVPEIMDPEVIRLEGWPRTSRNTAKWIIEALFAEGAGINGAMDWVNRGFRTNDKVPDGYVDLSEVKIIRKEQD
jgi:hypothetical protein